jgi:hypothetical protein
MVVAVVDQEGIMASSNNSNMPWVMGTRRLKPTHQHPRNLHYLQISSKH